MKRMAVLTALAMLAIAGVSAVAQDVVGGVAEVESLLAKTQFDAALDAANTAVKAAPSDPEAYLSRFRVYMARAQDEEALADINPALELAPANAKYLTARARLRVAREQHDAALKDLDAALAADEAYVLALILRAHVRSVMDLREDALADANRAVELEPDSEEAYLARAAAWSCLGNTERWGTDVFRATEVNPESAAAWNSLGVYELMGRRDAASAVDAFSKAISLDPQDVRAICGRAAARSGKGDEAGALEDTELALKVDGACVQAFMIRAGILRKDERYGEAVAALRRALEIEPANTQCLDLLNAMRNEDGNRLIGQAETFLNDGEYDKAAERVRKALEIDPTSVAYNQALMIIEAQREKSGR